VTQALWWSELVAMATQREWTLNVGQRTAYERLSHLMVEMYLRLESVGLASEGRLDWPLTQNDLADATGLTPVHVNRTLQLMRKDGLIELAHRQLVIPDLKRLKAAAMFNDNYLHLNHEGANFDANA
jgi:CRP-like cAMP-binding protein